MVARLKLLLLTLIAAAPLLAMSAAADEASSLHERAFIVRSALASARFENKSCDSVKGELSALMLLAEKEEDIYEKAACAHAEAEAAAFFISSDRDFAISLKNAAESDLAFMNSWLDDYSRINTVHGYEEPAWIKGRPEVAAQAVLAWTKLEKVFPDNSRRTLIAKFSEGILKTMRGSYCRYPFGSHFSYVTSEGKPRNFQIPLTDKFVAGASIIVERQYQAAALAEAGALLGDSKMLESAEREGLGFLAFLAISGRYPFVFSPRPENEVQSSLAQAAVVENLAVIKRISGKDVFSSLTGCASIGTDKLSGTKLNEAIKTFCGILLKDSGCTEWIGAYDICPPFAGQSVELEDGKAVQKAFDVYPIVYPGGTPGKLVTVGRDNMFWMRFDVDREDEYFFHLCFLKSSVSGGLVSVMMRIDGDQIFQVNLGGATDDPYVDVDMVAGPRHLRQGPHSFGIRFSGLLMKHPAVLDSILVEPAVQRRWVKRMDGKGILVMNSTAEDNLKVRMQELEANDNCNWSMVTGLGTKAQHNVTKDRRGRLWLEIPGGSVASLEWPDTVPGLPEE